MKDDLPAKITVFLRLAFLMREIELLIESGKWKVKVRVK